MSDFDDPEIFRTVIETLQTGVYAVDRDRRIMLWNDGAERITGYLRQDVVGRTFGEGLLMHCDANGCELPGELSPLAATILDGRRRLSRVGERHNAPAGR